MFRTTFRSTQQPALWPEDERDRKRAPLRSCL